MWLQMRCTREPSPSRSVEVSCARTGRHLYKVNCPKNCGLVLDVRGAAQGPQSHVVLVGARHVWVASWHANSPPTTVTWHRRLGTAACFVSCRRDGLLVAYAFRNKITFCEARTTKHCMTMRFDECATSLVADTSAVLVCFETSNVVRIDTATQVVSTANLRAMGIQYESAASVRRVDEGYEIGCLSGTRITLDHTMTVALAHTTPDRKVTVSQQELVDAAVCRDVVRAEAVLRLASPTKQYVGQALAAAIAAGDVNMTRLLFDYNADPRQGLTAVFFSARAGSELAILRVVLSRPDFLEAFSNPRQPLQLLMRAAYQRSAVRASIVGLTQLLLQRRCAVGPRLLAHLLNYVRTTNTLVEEVVDNPDVNVNAESYDGQLCICAAMQSLDWHLVGQLIDRGADVSKVGTNRRSAVTIALSKSTGRELAAYRGALPRLLRMAGLLAPRATPNDVAARLTLLTKRVAPISPQMTILMAAGAKGPTPKPWTISSHLQHELAVRRMAATIFLVAARTSKLPTELWTYILFWVDTTPSEWVRAW